MHNLSRISVMYSRNLNRCIPREGEPAGKRPTLLHKVVNNPVVRCSVRLTVCDVYCARKVRVSIVAVADERKAVCVVYTDGVVELVIDNAVSVPRFVFVFTLARGIVSFSGCIKQFISAVGYGVTLTCVAVACTTFLTVVA